MISLFKLEMWLFRYSLPILVIGPFLLGWFFPSDNVVSPLIIILVLSMSLVQLEEKNGVARFMNSLPLNRSDILLARILVISTCGFMWLFFESLARVMTGTPITPALLFYMVSMIVMIVLLATILAITLKLMRPGILRWVIIFVVYGVAIILMTLATTISTQWFAEQVSSWVTYSATIGTAVMGALLFWLLFIAGMAIHKKQDVV
ncbi:ABC-2 transporter permease [Geomicrobium sp. JCM 19039]|uniref:ABC-2 transporter permease n=1 Tax=Geomicrobium sp. JCM 19039 TaxID=1460636 RepID=UPI00045F334F|nr:ABC-2 transporter permease [Geomicrobium sp. JCM 19039]GAK13480.1 hypothetical protein JCM19039_3331 [Geomicrobium sp. JCM 19039]